LAAVPELNLAEIQRVAERIAEGIERTPCVHSRTLSQITGAEVYLKLENLQFTASFKDRGALAALLNLDEEQRTRGVIAMSAGNHAQAVAYHAQRLGVKAVIVMPEFTPTTKVEHTRAFGAEVILHGDTFDDARTHAEQIRVERGLHLLHPYDDPMVILGQGTIGLEVFADQPDIEAMIVPIGGGGLISGCALAASGLAPGVRVYGVETQRFPSMRCALAGESERYGEATIADGIAVKTPGRLTLPIIKSLISDILLVDEPELEQAVLLLLDVEKTVAEGAGAAGLAALLQNRALFEGKKVCLIVSGGNIDLSVLSSVIQRGLVRDGRLVRVGVKMRDIPGSLARVTRTLADTRASVVQVSHQRTFTHLPLQEVEAQFVLQTRGAEHVQEIVAQLVEVGFGVRVLDE